MNGRGVHHCNGLYCIQTDYVYICELCVGGGAEPPGHAARRLSVQAILTKINESEEKSAGLSSLTDW